MKTFKFGKHKGELLEDVAINDPSYFKWALDNVDGFRAYAAGIKPHNEKRSIPIRSSCGNGFIKNEGFPKPGRKKFVSKRTNPYVHSTEAPKGAFDPNGFQTKERVDYHMSQLNPDHRALEALEDHLDMVFMKHHGDQFTGEFENDEPPW